MLTIREAERRLNNLKIGVTKNMLDSYGLPTARRNNPNRICLKGQGRLKEVIKVIEEIIGSSRPHPQTANQIMDYIDPYLRGRITREELMYTISSWFIGDNLKSTALMDAINDHEKEWKELMKDPKVWYDQYWKVTDEKSGKVTVEPCDGEDRPFNIIDSDLERKLNVAPGNVGQLGGIGKARPQPLPFPAQTIADGSNKMSIAEDHSTGIEISLSNIEKAVYENLK